MKRKHVFYVVNINRIARSNSSFVLRRLRISTRREKSRVKRELMSFTRGLLAVRILQASLAMFTMTSCVQCTTSSLVLNAPKHLRKSLKSIGLIATLRCTKSVKYFQEIPRTFSVMLLAIAF